MGSLNKSLRKANGLQGFIGGLQKFVDKRKRQNDQQEFNKLMTTAIDNIRQTYNQQPEDKITSMPDPTSQLGKDFMPAVNDNPQGNIKVNEQPTDFILGDANQGRKFGTVTPDEQRMKIQRQIADTMLKAGQLKNLDPNKLKQGVGLLDLMGRSYTPATPRGKKLKSINPKNDLYEIDENGNFTLKKKGIQTNKKKNIGSYVGKDGFHYTQMYNPETDTVKEIKSDNPVRVPKTKGAKIPKSEKWKDFGSVINSIYYKVDPLTNQIAKRDPQEQKQMRIIGKNKALGNLLPNALDFMRTRIWNTWGRENISQADFEAEILEGIDAGELDPEEAQDLLDFNKFRPYFYDQLTETKKVNPEGK